MKKLLIILFFLPLFIKAQTNYDRLKQDPKIQQLQIDVNSAKIDNNSLKIEVAKLKLDVANLTKRLDSIRPVIIYMHPSTGLTISKNLNDTITIYKAPTR